MHFFLALLLAGFRLFEELKTGLLIRLTFAVCLRQPLYQCDVINAMKITGKPRIFFLPLGPSFIFKHDSKKILKTAGAARSRQLAKSRRRSRSACMLRWCWVTKS